MALGRTRLLFGVSVVYALVHLPAFIAGTVLYGLPGAIGSIVLAGALYIALNFWMLQRTLAIGWGEIMPQLGRPALATSVMAVVVMALALFAAPDGLLRPGSWSALVSKVLAGGVTYVIALVATWRLQGRPAGIEARLLRLLRS